MALLTNTTKEQVLDRLRPILSEMLGVPEHEVEPKADLVDDLGADSLDTVEIAMEVEEEFDVEFPDVDFDGVRTVDDLASLVLRRSRGDA